MLIFRFIKKGIDGVLVNFKNRPPLSPTVSKVSSGALELMDIYCIKKTETFIENSLSNFKLITTDLEDKEYRENIELNEFTPNKEDNIIVILGSEANGVSDSLKNLCESNLKIRSKNPKIDTFPFSLVDSLNVSVASSLIMNKLV